jgi:hypothetical protein
MTNRGGKRSGTRRGAKPPRQLRPISFVLALGVTATAIAWGFLVYLAINYGRDVRSGDTSAWRFVAAAALGAVICLQLAFLLLSRVNRSLTGSPQSLPPQLPVLEPSDELQGGPGFVDSSDLHIDETQREP